MKILLYSSSLKLADLFCWFFEFYRNKGTHKQDTVKTGFLCLFLGIALSGLISIPSQAVDPVHSQQTDLGIRELPQPNKNIPSTTSEEKTQTWKPLKVYILEEEKTIRHLIAAEISRQLPDVFNKIHKILDEHSDKYRVKYHNMRNGSIYIRSLAIPKNGSSDPAMHLLLARVLFMDSDFSVRATALNALSQSKKINDSFVHLILANTLLNESAVFVKQNAARALAKSNIPLSANILKALLVTLTASSLQLPSSSVVNSEGHIELRLDILNVLEKLAVRSWVYDWLMTNIVSLDPSPQISKTAQKVARSIKKSTLQCPETFNTNSKSKNTNKSKNKSETL